MSLPFLQCAIPSCCELRRRGDALCPYHALDADVAARNVVGGDVREGTAYWRRWLRWEADDAARQRMKRRERN